jgi:hypothetical protein
VTSLNGLRTLVRRDAWSIDRWRVNLRRWAYLTPRGRGGEHTRCAAPLWPELVLHYLVAAFTWTRAHGDDDSALDRGVRGAAAFALVGVVVIVRWWWWV